MTMALSFLLLLTLGTVAVLPTKATSPLPPNQGFRLVIPAHETSNAVMRPCQKRHGEDLTVQQIEIATLRTRL